jgi:hypothetical protein
MSTPDPQRHDATYHHILRRLRSVYDDLSILGLKVDPRFYGCQETLLTLIEDLKDIQAQCVAERSTRGETAP